MRIIFAGTPEFSLSALNALLDSEHTVIAVYTQPDRPAGRGRKLKASPIKERALEEDIPLFQPATLRDEDEQKTLQALNADLMVVVAYGLILPIEVLEAPRFGCLNIHASLLPRWRGAAPIQRAILAGDAESGVTIMQMDIGLDTGDMLHKVTTKISADDSAEQLHDRLSALGGKALMDTIKQIEDSSLNPEPQIKNGDESLVTYAEKLNKKEAKIDWNDSASAILRQINAFNPWPVAQSEWDGKIVRIWRAEVVHGKSSQTTGSSVDITTSGIDITTGDSGENRDELLRILELQLPGKRPMKVADFLNSRPQLKEIGMEFVTQL